MIHGASRLNGHAGILRNIVNSTILPMAAHNQSGLMSGMRGAGFPSIVMRKMR